jgi:hypothetical protein
MTEMETLLCINAPSCFITPCSALAELLHPAGCAGAVWATMGLIRSGKDKQAEEEDYPHLLSGSTTSSSSGAPDTSRTARPNAAAAPQKCCDVLCGK